MFIICRLTLPGRIVEDGREKASFDIDKGRSHNYMIITHTGLFFLLTLMQVLPQSVERVCAQHNAALVTSDVDA